MSVKGIWSVEIIGLFTWEHIGIVMLEKGRAISGGNNHYSVGEYKVSGNKINISSTVQYFGKTRVIFGAKEKNIKLQIKGKIKDGVIEAIAVRKGPGADKEIPCRLTRCADLPSL